MGRRPRGAGPPLPRAHPPRRDAPAERIARAAPRAPVAPRAGAPWPPRRPASRLPAWPWLRETWYRQRRTQPRRERGREADAPDASLAHRRHDRLNLTAAEPWGRDRSHASGVAGPGVVTPGEGPFAGLGSSGLIDQAAVGRGSVGWLGFSSFRGRTRARRRCERDCEKQLGSCCRRQAASAMFQRSGPFSMQSGAPVPMPT